MRYTHAQMSPIFRTTKLATAWSRTYPHGYTLPQLVTNPENHQATAQPSPHPSKGLHGAFKTSPAPYPATLQHSTISSFHSCWDCASSEEHCLVPPGCTRGRERVTNTPGVGSLLKEARCQVHRGAPGQTERDAAKAPGFPGWTYSPEQRQLWCNATPCRQPGNRPGCNCDEASRSNI